MVIYKEGQLEIAHEANVVGALSAPAMNKIPALFLLTLVRTAHPTVFLLH